ncbi:hypothetical protein P7F88_06770 [Vibrio hannami]|nr:hypothetical protein [Vibrio hannami]MDG3085813.1 hypothetical protein [Vibrio hannami]
MTAQASDSELAKFIYMCINVLLLCVGVLLNRRIFTIVGGVGVFIYLNHLAVKVFEDNFLYPISLTVIGFALIRLGVWFHKNKAEIEVRIEKFVPIWLARLREARR